MAAFEGIQADSDRSTRDEDVEIADNFMETFVEYSRSNQIGNEEQAMIAFFGYVSGLLPDWHDYLGVLITGGASGGKSHMKREVLDNAFDYKWSEWIYHITSGSDKATIDDEDIDDARVASFDELNQIPSEMKEFLKRVVEDGGFTYGRNVSDDAKASGRSTVKFTRDPLSIVFMLADENELSIEKELRDRMVEVKVEENESKNKGVHFMKHGHESIKLGHDDAAYIWDDPELAHAVKAHVRDIPVDTPVVIPTGTEDFEGDEWDEAAVTAPLLNFKRSESTRASKAIASLVKCSALVNYHSRSRVEIDGEKHIVAAPQDVGNVLACRSTLLATTHGLTEKKFAVLDAIRERGSTTEAGSTALQATKQQIIEEIQENPDISTLSKSEINDILEELDEHLIINTKDNPEDRRENLYVYDGGATFNRPNIYDYIEHFGDVTDPIAEQPIEQTIEEQMESLEAKMDTRDILGSESDESAREPHEKSVSEPESDAKGLDAFGAGSDSEPAELSQMEAQVAEKLGATLDGLWVPARYSDDLHIAHMVGAAPTDTYESEGNVRGDAAEMVEMIEPVEEASAADYDGTIMSPEHELWKDDMDQDDVLGAIESTIATLKDMGVFVTDMDDAGNTRVEVRV